MGDTHTVILEARISPLEIKEVKLQAWGTGMLKNASLQAMKGRIKQLKRNPAWRVLGAWKPKDDEEWSQRSLAYKLLFQEYAISEYDCIKAVQKHWKRSGWLPDHIDGRMCTRLGGELWEELERWLYKAGGEPGFKAARKRSSVLGNDNQSGLRYLPGTHNQPGRIKERTQRMQHSKGPLAGKALKIRTDWSKVPKQRAEYYLSRQGQIRQTKLVLVEFPNKKHPKVEVHLVYDCLPYRSQEYLEEVKGKAGKAECVSMDFGPQGAAWVDDKGNRGFVMPEEALRKEIRRLRYKRKQTEKRMDKSRREMNPDCYEQECKGKYTQGKSIKGKSHTVKSKAQKQREKQRKNLYSEETKLVSQYHRCAIRKIVKLASNLITEHDRFDEWKKGGYGKSIQTYATGSLKSLLMRELAILGGWTHEHDPYITKLSSYCLCGIKRKKDVKEREHICDNPKCRLYQRSLHRDLFSAYLGLLVKKHGLSRLIKGKLITEHWTTAVEICSTGSVVSLEAPLKGQTSTLGPDTGGDLDRLGSGGEASSSRPPMVSSVNDSRLESSKPTLMSSSKDLSREDHEGKPQIGIDRQNASYINPKTLE